MRKHKLGDTVVQAKDLKKHFNLSGGIIAALTGQPARVAKALDGIDISIRSGEVVGLVGESGCGKSTLGMTLVRMHEPSAGDIQFKGESITEIKGNELKSFRSKAQIIFQDPYSSLNPRLTIGEIVEEPLKIHRKGDPVSRREKVREALTHVRLPVEDYEHRYPADLSGGQRQRVAIARALVLDPEFIVADEPVSMLDVSVQAGVLQILDELSQDLGLAVLYISHDIATVGYICDKIAVMYLGRVVEMGAVQDVMRRPKHPYTQALMQAIPNTDPLVNRERVVLEGDVPSPIDTPRGCRFASRCMHVDPLCEAQEPDLYLAADDCAVRCHLFDLLAHRRPNSEGEQLAV
ncbi:oligopeptide/dipeptide ABC transporter ATP-binding protein [Pacificibacter sp.]|uniref:ABC transporter ATP-binding protein n=1 Tax=Pacificibacter sp. TaxID=1917866 RepID=UPI00321BC9D0